MWMAPGGGRGRAHARGELGALRQGRCLCGNFHPPTIGEPPHVACVQAIPHHSMPPISLSFTPAAKLSAFLESLLATAARAAEAAGPDSDADNSEQEDDVAVPGRADQDGCSGRPRGRPAHRFRAEALRGLHQELLAAQSHGYLRLMGTPRLKQLLLALNETAGSGVSRVLAEDDEVRGGE